MEVFDTTNWKFTTQKYRGDLIPQGRQAHTAVMMNQYAMIVIGGTYQDTLIDPIPVPENDSILSFDTESGHWQRIKVKNQGGEAVVGGQDVVPWNLVHHTAFKLDSQNIGVLWYDPEQNDTLEITRHLMISVFNCKKCLWKNLKVAKYNEPGPLRSYHFQQSVMPILDVDQDRVSRVLIFGGYSLENPLSQTSSLPFMQLDFSSSLEHFSQTDESHISTTSAPKTKKTFSED